MLWLDIRGTAGLQLGISFPLSGILFAISIPCDLLALRSLVILAVSQSKMEVDLGSV